MQKVYWEALLGDAAEENEEGAVGQVELTHNALVTEASADQQGVVEPRCPFRVVPS